MLYSEYIQMKRKLINLIDIFMNISIKDEYTIP